MARPELFNSYFKWLCKFINVNTPPKNELTYGKLLNYLYDAEFIHEPMDENRAVDGIDLRYRFGSENEYTEEMIRDYLDIKPCSILEMMVALSIRSEAVMDDQDMGDRTGVWFWGMVSNLGLDAMIDRRFNISIVDHKLEVFLNRDYGKNGDGGLFTIHRTIYDLRSVDIWYQMCWYLNEILGG